MRIRVLVALLFGCVAACAGSARPDQRSAASAVDALRPREPDTLVVRLSFGDATRKRHREVRRHFVIHPWLNAELSKLVAPRALSPAVF